MNGILENPAVQTAMVTLIVIALNALAAWVKGRTQGSLVEANWCYLQPAVQAAMQAARDALKGDSLLSGDLARIVDKALVTFAEQYTPMEGREPTLRELDAAAAEIKDAVERVLNGEA